MILPQAACSPSAREAPEADAQTLSPADAKLKHKFRGIRGAERRIDGLVVMKNVVLRTEKGYVVESGTFGPRGGSVSGWGERDFVVPKTIRMMYYGNAAFADSYYALQDVGESGYKAEAKYSIRHRRAPPTSEKVRPMVDITVPVAERIPVEVLDEVRAGRGSLRVKIRVTPEGPLIGWDIENRPGYDPKLRDANGWPIHFPAVHTFVGGDFQEAPLIYDHTKGCDPCRGKGWYIDKKTGQKIETDF